MRELTTNQQNNEMIVISRLSRARSGKVKLGFMQYDPTDPVCIYLEDLAEKSQKAMYGHIRQFGVWFYQNENILPENIVWADVTYADIKAYQQFLKYKHENPLYKLKKPLSINTQNIYITAIRNVLKKSAKIRGVAPDKKISSESYLEIMEIKLAKGKRISPARALTPEEIKSFVCACNPDKPSKRDLRDLAIFFVMVNCGLRMNELITMQYPKSLDIAEKGIVVLGKGNKERFIPMNDITFTTIKRYLDEVRGLEEGNFWYPISKSQKLIKNKCLTSNGVRHILEQRGIKGNVERFRPHDLRRTFGTSLLEKGVDIFTTQDLLGHASADTTKRYDMRGEKRKRDAVELINNGFI